MSIKRKTTWLIDTGWLLVPAMSCPLYLLQSAHSTEILASPLRFFA